MATVAVCAFAPQQRQSASHTDGATVSLPENKNVHGSASVPFPRALSLTFTLVEGEVL